MDADALDSASGWRGDVGLAMGKQHGTAYNGYLSRVASSPSQTRPLSELRAGETSLVNRVDAESRVAKRLADLGFIGGARLEMVRPGVPCIVRINGGCVGLGRGHQLTVLVDGARTEREDIQP